MQEPVVFLLLCLCNPDPHAQYATSHDHSSAVAANCNTAPIKTSSYCTFVHSPFPHTYNTTTAEPFRWFPVNEEELTAQTPTDVDVIDTNKGEQSGLNDRPALRGVAATSLKDFLRNSIWMYHASCDLCRHHVSVYGSMHKV